MLSALSSAVCAPSQSFFSMADLATATCDAADSSSGSKSACRPAARINASSILFMLLLLQVASQTIVVRDVTDSTRFFDGRYPIGGIPFFPGGSRFESLPYLVEKSCHDRGGVAFAERLDGSEAA